jgi:hypothetical protein
LRDPKFLAPCTANGEVTDEMIKEETEKMEKLPINERPFYQVGMVKKQKMNFVLSSVACLLA